MNIFTKLGRTIKYEYLICRLQSINLSIDGLHKCIAQKEFEKDHYRTKLDEFLKQTTYDINKEIKERAYN